MLSTPISVQNSLKTVSSTRCIRSFTFWITLTTSLSRIVFSSSALAGAPFLNLFSSFSISLIHCSVWLAVFSRSTRTHRSLDSRPNWKTQISFSYIIQISLELIITFDMKFDGVEFRFLPWILKSFSELFTQFVFLGIQCAELLFVPTSSTRQ